MDNSCQLEQHVLLHRIHCRPVLDVRTVAKLCLRTRSAVAVVYAALVYLLVVNVWLVSVLVLYVCRSRNHAAVGCCSSDRACVHERNERELTLTRLRTLAVGEVACGVADRQTVVRRNVACAEARTAECRLHHNASLDEVGCDAFACYSH